MTPSSFSTSGRHGACESSSASRSSCSGRCPACQNLWYGRQSTVRDCRCTASPRISWRSRASIAMAAPPAVTGLEGEPDAKDGPKPKPAAVGRKGNCAGEARPR